MAIALEGVPALTVRALTRGFNQAAVLVAEHAIKIDDAAALSENDEVTFTDDDLGFIFSGRITDRNELWTGGEGIIYTCADVFRTIAKEPARLNGSTKIEIVDRTSGKQLIEDLLDEYIANGNPLAGGYDTSAIEDVQIEPMDMAGQSMFEWIDTVLRQTEDSVCWIEYDGSNDPVLLFDRVANRPDLDLVVGQYTVVDPDTDDNPLIVQGQIGNSLDNKYSKVEVEGCGEFERFDLRWLEVASITRPNTAVKIYHYRFNIPDDWTNQRYLDDDGNCREGYSARILVGGTGSPPGNSLTLDIQNVPVLQDESTKQWYFEIKYLAGGIVSDPPPIPAMQAWFTYTGYVGPFVASRISSAFSGEGTLIQQHPDLFKYTGPVSSFDDSFVLSAIADRLYERYCVEPDREGSLNIHIKGFDAGVNLGAKIVAPTSLRDPFIRALRYDFVARDIILGCSDVPLRPEVGDAQQKARMLSELRGNWYLSKDHRDPSCFCGGQIFVDEEGNRFQGNNANPPDPGPSWDCIGGECIERDDARGTYSTLSACEDVCWETGFDFLPCVGCVEAAEGWGQYETMTECENDNPDPFASEYNCTSGASGASAPGPGSGAQGNTFACSGCECDAGSGKYFLGFIKRIKVSSSGKIVTAECDTCTFDIISGWTGTVSVLANAIVNMVGTVAVISKCWHIMVYSDGIITDVDSTVGCDDFKSEGTTSKGIIATDYSGCGS